MNKLISFLLILSLFSCTVTDEPEFLNLSDYKIMSFNKKIVRLATTAHFNNTNDVGCEVILTDINVSLNDIFVSKVNQTNSIELEAGDHFSIPMIVSIPTEKIVKDKSGIFNGLLTALMDKNLSVQYDGFVRLRKAGIEFDIDIEGEETIMKFKKL